MSFKFCMLYQFTRVWLVVFACVCGFAGADAFAAAETGTRELPVVVDGAESQKLVDEARNPDGRCIAVRLGDEPEGTLLVAKPSRTLAPGRYRLHVPMALAPLGDEKTAFMKIVIAAGEKQRRLGVLSFVESYSFRDFTLDFAIEAQAQPEITVNWFTELTKDAKKNQVKGTKLPGAPVERGLAGETWDDRDPLGLEDEGQSAESLIEEFEAGVRTQEDDTIGKDDLRKLKHCLAFGNAHIEELSPLGITDITTEKIAYTPGEEATGRIVLHNYSTRVVGATVTAAVKHGLESSQEILARDVKVQPRQDLILPVKFSTEGLYWGAELQVTAEVSGRGAAAASTVFAVRANFWETAIATFATLRETNAENMDRVKADLFTVIEYFFWAPDDFGDLTPDKEVFFGGQLTYPGSTGGTQQAIEAAHDRGIAAVVYATLWGGGGPPAFELMRKHPDWFLAAGCKTFWLENWPLMEQNKVPPLRVWPYTTVNWREYQEPMDYHAAELIGTHHQFGWDGVRYDAYFNSEWVKQSTAHVRQVVGEKLPEFRFAYNSPAPWALPGLLEVMVSGGGFLMREAPKKAWSRPTAFDGFGNNLLTTGEQCWQAGGHFGVIPGEADEAIPLDHRYLSAFMLAAGGHPYGSTPYNRFALRYSEFLFDNTLRLLEKPAEIIAFGDDVQPWQWQRLARVKNLEGGRQRYVLNLINPPVQTHTARNFAQKTPAPMNRLVVRLKLPEGMMPRGAWLLDPDETRLQRLEIRRSNGETEVIVPTLRLWQVLVVETDLQEAS